MRHIDVFNGGVHRNARRRRKAFDVDFMFAEGVIDPEDRKLFWYAETAGWPAACEWLRARRFRSQ